MSDDKELLRRIAKQDRKAMKLFYERHHDALYAFLIGRGADSTTAADVVQDTMLEVWRSAQNFTGASAPKTWTFSIGRNKLVDRVRKNARMVVTDDVPETIDETPDPEAAAIAAGEAGRIRHCLDKLKAAHRTAIRLAFYEDLNYEEIGEIEDIPVSTVKTRIFHAKKLLMRCLGSSGLKG